jgi:hypothetical protein
MSNQENLDGNQILPAEQDGANGGADQNQNGGAHEMHAAQRNAIAEVPPVQGIRMPAPLVIDSSLADNWPEIV